MLHPTLEAELATAREHQNDYLPNAIIGQHLGDKTLCMVVGPAGVGKTTIMNRAVELDPDFGRAAVFCTREPRDDDDPGMFRNMEHDNATVRELLDRIKQKEVVQYAVHPTQGTIYGTEAMDYAAPYNMLATLSGVVEGMRRLPFLQTHTFGVITEPTDWQEWFDERFPVGHPDRTKRLSEARISLDWLLQDRLVLWLRNDRGDIDSTAKRLIAMSRGEIDSEDLRDTATKLLEKVEEL